MSNIILYENEPHNFKRKLRALLKQTKAQKGVIQGVRNIKHGQPNKCITFHFSHKNSALMPCESSLEANHCLTLDFNHLIHQYITQPFELSYGNNKTYTPDTLHIDELGTLVVREIKTNGALESERLRDKLQLLKDIFEKGNIRFEIVTELLLPSPTLLNNLRYIYSRTDRNPSPAQLKRIQDYIRGKAVPLAKLRSFCKKSGYSEFSPEHLIYQQKIFINLEKPITPESTIQIGEQ